ncbi:MAG TPA: Abi family protein [Anaerolineales bacterium]|nr:Abi family protein [Anaerolineales bacterium]
MNYTKPALSFEQQAQRLIERGLIVPDKAALVSRLKAVNYYRLSAYWYPFKRIDPVSGEEGFLPNTDFETIWRRYTFDRELRLLVMDAVERVEVSILRTRLVEQFTLLHGPFGYTDIKNFSPRFSPFDHARLLSELDEAVNRSKEEFVGRFRGKYSSEPRLPLWMASEVMTFGQMFTLFRNLHRNEQQSLSKQFNLYPPALVSWLHTLNFIRNACAHHARLWNRELPIRPQIPEQRHNPEWHTPFQFDNRRMFSVLSLLRYLLGTIDPQSDWQSRFVTLLLTYPEIPLNWMGMPKNWKESPIWKPLR